ncbi:DNA-methyltransferase [Cytobacillus solani]|uniref:Methyltransferase n=1 Tax=Cytobacillus solani TaxID=1637975 RepID=A0A0Q3QLH3_9BACI|nr:site-specific DNA-methyltransferase [Cytobacillus solani]KQL18841.1 restriction endonuclease [Cytobacillus solani]
MTKFINEILTGDNVEILRLIDDNFVDLTVTSPPYDDLRAYNGYTWDPELLANELYRVTKDGGVVVWIVGDRTVKGSETGSSFKQALTFMDTGFRLHDTMIYMKDSISFPETTRYYQIFEYMFIFSKGSPKTVNLISDRKNKWVGHRIRGRERQVDGSLAGRRKGNPVKEFGVRYNIWQVSTGYMKSSKDVIAYDHPAIFPESLAEDHILSWSDPGGIVLDPFGGSGTTAKMAKINGRQFIHTDISEEYNEIARRRLEDIA